MSFPYFLAGLTEGANKHFSATRQRNRDLEDQALERNIGLLKTIASSPNFDARYYDQVLQDTAAQIQHASSGKKAGGFRGGMMGEYTPSPVMHVIQMARQHFGAPGASPAVDGTPPPLGGTPPPPQQVAQGGDDAGGDTGTTGTPATLPPPPGAAAPPTTAAQPLTPMPDARAASADSPGSHLVTAGNDLAKETQQPVPVPKPPPRAASPMQAGPPAVPYPNAYADNGPFMSPEVRAQRGANEKFMGEHAAQSGAISGKVAGASSALGGGSLPPDVIQHLALGTPYQTYRTSNATLNGQPVVVKIGNRGSVSTMDDQPISGELHLEGTASPYVVRSIVGPDGSVTTQWAPRNQPGGKVTAQQTAPAGTGKVQFAPPPINVGESSDEQGNVTRTLIPRERVGKGGAAAPAAGAAAASTGSNTGTTIERTPGGGMTVRRAPVAKFSQQQQTALAGISSAQKFAEDALDFLKENHLEHDNSPLEARWNAFLYQHHIDPGEAEKLIQTVGIAEPKAIVGQMGGQRGEFFGKMFQQHTAQPMDTYAFMFKKLNNMVSIGDQIKKDINTSAIQVPTPSGPQVPGNRRPKGGRGITPPPGGGTVKMKAPDGRSLTVPADKVDEMKAHGAVVVQ